MIPQADLGSCCVEAKILRPMNDALTTAITVHDTKGPLDSNLCIEHLRESSRDVSLEPGDEDDPWLDDSLWPVTVWVCGMRPGAIFTLPSTSAHLSLSSIYGALQCIWWFSAGLQPTGDTSGSEQPAPCLQKGSRNDRLKNEVIWPFQPHIGGKWLQIGYSTHMYNINSNIHTQRKMSPNSLRLCFLRLLESCAAVRQIAAWH